MIDTYPPEVITTGLVLFGKYVHVARSTVSSDVGKRYMPRGLSARTLFHNVTAVGRLLFPVVRLPNCNMMLKIPTNFTEIDAQISVVLMHIMNMGRVISSGVTKILCNSVTVLTLPAVILPISPGDPCVHLLQLNSNAMKQYLKANNTKRDYMPVLRFMLTTSDRRTVQCSNVSVYNQIVTQLEHHFSMLYTDKTYRTGLNYSWESSIGAESILKFIQTGSIKPCGVDSGVLFVEVKPNSNVRQSNVPHFDEYFKFYLDRKLSILPLMNALGGPVFDTLTNIVVEHCNLFKENDGVDAVLHWYIEYGPSCVYLPIPVSFVFKNESMYNTKVFSTPLREAGAMAALSKKVRKLV
ncbi:hypothetical protein QAD02_006659 [Eretmocerus hayati]|uniref:Uncharacterized protein n=1 Tax=Eretmocerus hayati TaxID=131215 RepID=A0ACC2N1J8_9HYME|nr:hypothetical protein QAD02_006659 [Eretmocerus hayati]